MQSSFKVIKNTTMSKDTGKDINTSFISKQSGSVRISNDSLNFNPRESYENIGNTIISEAKRKSELIIATTCEELEQMKKQVYEQAYSEGIKKGFQEGYSQSMEQAQEEVKVIKEKANKVLFDSIEESNKYLVAKEKEFKELIQNAVEKILKQEVKDKESMNAVVYDALCANKKTAGFIIKCNSLYCEEIKLNIQKWKDEIPFSGGIFVIKDDTIPSGNVLINRDNGKTEISIEGSVSKIRDILFSEE